MYHLNKLFWFLLNPLTIATIVVIVGLRLTYGSRRKIGWWLVGMAVCGLMVLSMPITAHLLGWGIERNYQELSAKDFPGRGDVVLDLGGSWVRSWYAAELVKAGKAKAVIPSANNIKNQDVPLIRDLGVPENAIWVEDQARNTEENIKFAKRILGDRSQELGVRERVRVLLVTSAVHMPRAMLTMRKYWPEADVVPAPCDFMTTKTFERGWSWQLFKPSLTTYMASEAFLHEYVGFLYYLWLR